MTQVLTINIYSDHYDYSSSDKAIPSNGTVIFHNQLDTAIYLTATDNRPCPFSENWPQCIPAGQKVVRQLLQPLYNSGKFTFHYLPLPGTNPQLVAANQHQTQDPKDDGEVIVKDY